MSENRTFADYNGVRLDVSIDSSAEREEYTTSLRSIRASARPWRDTIGRRDAEFVRKAHNLVNDGLTNPETFGSAFLLGCAKEETEKQAQIEAQIQELLLQWSQHEVSRAIYATAEALISAKVAAATVGWVNVGPSYGVDYEQYIANKVYKMTVRIKHHKDDVAYYPEYWVSTNSTIAGQGLIITEGGKKCTSFDMALQYINGRKVWGEKKYFDDPNPVIVKSAEHLFRINDAKLPGFRYESDEEKAGA